MTSTDATSALSKPTTSPPPYWQHQTEILPAALASHGLQCRDETPASARDLLSRGQLAAEDFIESSPDIERTLMEAFVEDDYDGRLHLTTLSSATSAIGGGDATTDEETIGMAFWREVPDEEMAEWMDLRRISAAIAGGRLASANYDADSEDHDDDLSRDAQKSLRLVRSESVGWIRNALQTRDIGDSKSTIRELTHAWIKIELIAVKRTRRGHRLGSVLLGCTLARARRSLRRGERAILHVAGGGASRNVPAARLYARYGFVPIPRHEEGGPFVRPDRDLFVLGNIGMALEGLPWEEVMRIGDASDDVEDGHGGKRRALIANGSGTCVGDAGDDQYERVIHDDKSK